MASSSYSPDSYDFDEDSVKQKMTRQQRMTKTRGTGRTLSAGAADSHPGPGETGVALSSSMGGGGGPSSPPPPRGSPLWVHEAGVEPDFGVLLRGSGQSRDHSPLVSVSPGRASTFLSSAAGSSTVSGSSTWRSQKKQRCVGHSKLSKPVGKEKRKLREKRRSSGLVRRPPSTESGNSSPGELSDPGPGEALMTGSLEVEGCGTLRRQQQSPERIDADNPQTPVESPCGWHFFTTGSNGKHSGHLVCTSGTSDPEADLEDNQDSEGQASGLKRRVTRELPVQEEEEDPGERVQHLVKLLEEERAQRVELQRSLESRDHTIVQLEEEVALLREKLRLKST